MGKNCIICYKCFYLLQVQIKTLNGKLSLKNRKRKQKLKSKSGYRKCDLTDYQSATNHTTIMAYALVINQI